MKNNTSVEWRGNTWDLFHAIDFYKKGTWTREFTARWLGVSLNDFYQLTTRDCPRCRGSGRIWREYEVRT